MLNSTLLPKMDIILQLPVITGKDDLGNDIITYEEEVVKNCLVIGNGSQDLGFPAEELDKTFIRIDFPKTFTKSLSDGAILVFDRVFQIIGDPVPNPYSPLLWNRYVIAEGVL